MKVTVALIQLALSLVIIWFGLGVMFRAGPPAALLWAAGLAGALAVPVALLEALGVLLAAAAFFRRSR
jgi:hypothetical protein